MTTLLDLPFKGLTRQVAEAAIDLVQPSIELFLDLYARPAYLGLHLVVFKPFTDDLLTERAIRLEGVSRFRGYAISKGMETRRSGLPTRTMLADAPWEIIPEEDVRYAGAIIENNLVVAASGQLDFFDEDFSWNTLSNIQAILRAQLNAIPEGAPAYFKDFPADWADLRSTT